jgi:dTDP-4-amino-4,6-dideoxygalactose transaminase
MTIPLVDLKKQYAPLKTQIMAGIENVFEGMQLFLGENVRALEHEFANYCGAAHGIGISDGTAALHIILRAMGIGAGDEVITISHTFIATIEAIVLTGAKPVFVDIDPKTYLMDVSKVEAKITPQTRAILPVHLYGQTADMEPILDIARHHNLKVIEDTCQAHGASYRGKRSGNLGDAAAFSFYYSKNLGGYGEGGFITTNDDELATKIRMIRDHGSERRYYHDLIGLNGRLDEVQAVILRTKLPHLEEWNNLRRQHAIQYCTLLKNTPIVTPVESSDNRHIYHLFVISAPKRDELQTHLKSRGIASGIHYPVPVHQQASMSYLGYKAGDLPVTEYVVGEILSLPMYAELSEAEIETVSQAINEFYG